MNIRATIRYLMATALLTSVALISGCGGGGGGGSTPANTVVTGTASKGIIDPGGTVKIYAVDTISGSKGNLLASAVIKDKGSFSADLGTYSGAVILEVSGTYTDEATQTKVTIDPSTPLHAVVDAVDNGSNNNRKVAVTPLTDLAFGLVGTSISAGKIADANKQVSDLFKIDDIVATQPVECNAAAMKAAGSNQQKYTMSLAVLSQMAKPGAGTPASFTQIKAILDSFGSDIKSSASLGSKNISDFSNALNTAKQDPDLSEFTAIADELSTTGSKTIKVTMSAGTIPAGVQLEALKVTLTLPAGVSVRADDVGNVRDGIISVVGTPATGKSYTVGNYQSIAHTLTISLISTAGFGAGDFMTASLDVNSVTTATASDIKVTVNEAKDAGPTYGTVSGVTVTLR